MSPTPRPERHEDEMSNSSISGESIKIFFSYASKDEEWRDELAKHLRNLERRGIIQSWHDRQIPPGSEWDRVINTHLDTADIILLLLSPDFMDSDYCNDVEVARAMERHKVGDTVVIPILLRPVDLDETPFNNLQVLPRNKIPITTWKNHDEAFVAVARGIREVSKQLSNRNRPTIVSRLIQQNQSFAELIKSVFTMVVIFSVTLTVVGVIYYTLSKSRIVSLSSFIPQHDSTLTSAKSIEERMSTGERIIASQEVASVENPLAFQIAKQNGVDAIAAGNYSQAITEFNKALSVNVGQNSPESRIYLNNALIGRNTTSYTLAVVAPFSSKPDALAILRGVAQAQQEVNERGGINGVPLKIMLADDSDDSEVARQIAQTLAQNPTVLGVIGHDASDATLAAKEIYNSQGLPAISATSTSVAISEDLPEASRYVFRTVPHDGYTAKALADYMLETLDKQRVVIFFDSASDYSKSLKSEFIEEIIQGGGEIVDELDFSHPDFNAVEDVEQALFNDAQVLMLAGHIDLLDKVIEVIYASNGRFDLLGGDGLYNRQLLERLPEEGIGMVLAVAWHIQVRPDSELFAERHKEFVDQSIQLWNAQVNWSTAMAYDATEAMIAAIREEKTPTRSAIQQTLSNPSFITNGVSYPIQFSSSGDRRGKVDLVEIRPTESTNRFSSGTGYDFLPVKETN